PQGQSLVSPLQTLHTGGWELLRVYIPRQISRDVTLLSKITEAYRAVRRINETIRSREEYRLHNGAMSNFHSHMKLYDEDMRRENIEAALLVNDLLQALGILKRPQR